MSRLLILLLPLILVASCSRKNKTAKEILPPEKMEAVLWDMMRVDAFTTDYIRKDSTLNIIAENARLQKKVFAVHGITRESFYKSFDFYKSDPEQFKIMLDTLINKANRDRYKKISKPLEVN